MPARLLDGRAISETVLGNVEERVRARRGEGLPVPGLAVILVGKDPASRVYVRNKRKAVLRVGFRAHDFDLPAETTQAELRDLVARLNDDPTVHGILVQLPLPPHLDGNELIHAIRPEKDVDGFHPENIGRLALRQFGLRPCTPKGVMVLLAHTDRPVRGQNATIVGVSNNVGRPMAMELLIAGCTVTSCHRFTKDLEGHVRRADLVVAAAGRPGLVKGDWIKPGATVIDIGINRMPDGSLAGDVDFEVARERADWITPVPGGVGPMTVAMLMQNTLEAAESLTRASAR